MLTRKKANDALELVCGWVEKNGWAGYDPFTIYEHPFFKRIINWPNRLFLKVLRRFFFGVFNVCPLFWCKILKCKRQVNAKAMGIFAKAYLNRYKKTGENKYLTLSKECFDWLENNVSSGYSGKCWGYPFDWTTYYFIPRGTPSSVVTFTVGDAFWEAYRQLGDKKYLEICISICGFFINDLNKDVNGDALCFSYTPIDQMHVHNANLFVAEFLMRVGKEIDNKNYIETARKAINYTLEDQRLDGSWTYYYSKNSSYRTVIDGFHTGFVLRTLYSIYKLTHDRTCLDSVKKGFDFYLHNLFYDKTLPKNTNAKLYPIDIHACSEGMICLKELKSLDPLAEEVLDNLINWTIDNMQSKKGYFYYLKKRFGKVKIPYIRWGQSWMLLALTENT